MKTIKTILLPLIAFGAVWLLSGCDHSVETTTVVHEDGSLSKTIMLTGVDSSQVSENYLGISPETGWDHTLSRVPDKDGDGTDLRITFTKEFPDVDAVNAELNRDTDTLFQTETQLQKKFRWFYTYLEYSETYRKADRFRKTDPSTYFTPEEFAFIERMPARGSKVSESDSLFAEELNKKIFDVYSMEAILDEHFDYIENSLDNYGLPDRAKEKLKEMRPEFVKILTDEDGDDDSPFPEQDELALLNLVDSLVTPLPRPQIDEEYLTFSAEFDKRLNFMSWVSDGTFTNHVEMPWTIVETNADSIAGNRMTWEPPLMKFLITDYTMYATSRKMNVWAIAISAIFIIATLIMLIFGRKKKVVGNES